MLNSFNAFIPTQVVFGAGRLEELGKRDLPGKRPLICTTESSRTGHVELLAHVVGLLDERGLDPVVFDGFHPNPTDDEVAHAYALAAQQGCDFVIGLGGGTSIDGAKAVALLMRNEGDLWDYAYTGSGGKKAIGGAAPVVAISTTAGTGTETDPYSVITKTETGEKLDFAAPALFPALSFIDPKLMIGIPERQTVFQGVDALFHACECSITNARVNPLVDMFAFESISTVLEWLPIALNDQHNLNARAHLAFAADVCSGYTQALCGTTSHHIIAQTIGGMFPAVEHGASLIMIAEEYYKRISDFVPGELDDLGLLFGIAPVADWPGYSFIEGLVDLFDKLRVRHLPMSVYGIEFEDLPTIADWAVNRTGISDTDAYALSEKDVLDILVKSYR